MMTAPLPPHLVQDFISVANLQNDVVVAYGAAVQRLGDNHLRRLCETQISQHTQNIAQLGAVLQAEQQAQASQTDWRGTCAKGALSVAAWINDRAIVEAMITLEKSLAHAFEGCHEAAGLPQPLRDMLFDLLTQQYARLAALQQRQQNPPTVNRSPDPADGATSYDQGTTDYMG